MMDTLWDSLASSWRTADISLSNTSKWIYLAFVPLLYSILTWIYNLYLHPLAKYPGPFWARSSSVWLTLQSLKTVESRSVLQAHAVYGPVVRVAPNELSFSKPSATEAIYGNTKDIIKGPFYDSGHFLKGHANIFSMRDVKEHAARRKLMTVAFSQSSMLEFLPILNDKISEYMGAVGRQMTSQGNADFFQLSHWFAFEVVNMLAYGTDLAMLKTGVEHDVMRSVLGSGLTFLLNSVMFMDPKDGARLPTFVGKAYACLQEFEKFGSDVILKWRQTGVSTPFMERISAKPDQYLGRTLNDREILEESMGMMFAGSGTTANTLAYLFFEVGRNKIVQDKLAVELDDIANGKQDGPFLHYDDVKHLPYLNAVIRETMRLWPTIPGNRPRQTLKELLIDGEAVPAGTIVGMRNFVTHQDAETFEKPGLFQPERWLNATSDMKAAETGYGSGNRACIGRNLANMELLVLTANIIHTFELANTQNLTEQDMWMVDTFNGAPKCHHTRMGVKHRRAVVSHTEK